MTKDDLLAKFLEFGFGPKIADVFMVYHEMTANKTPKFSFALREDIREDKRFLPTRAEPKATGWDVRAAMSDKKPLCVQPFDYIKIPLGFRALCPEGWWFELKPRSSSFAKKHLHALYGTIDETYEGEMVFACQYIPPLERNTLCGPPSWETHCLSNTLEIVFGDAIGQLIPIRRQEMEVVECSNEEYNNFCRERNGTRGAGGFGSTGR